MTAPGNYPPLVSAGVSIIPAAHQTLLSGSRRVVEVGAVSSSCGTYPAWQNQATIAITNPVTIAGYQHQVTVLWRPGMKADFSDLRFAQRDGTPCPYWIESYTALTTALVWFKVPSANQREILLYYGNPFAMSESSTAIFEEFDHFEGASLGAGWTTYGTDTPTVSDSVASISLSGLTAKDCGFYMNDMFSSPAYAFRARIKPSAIGVTSGWTGKILWGLVDGHYTDTNYDWMYASILAPSSADAPKYLSNHSGGTQAKDTMAGTSYSDGMTAGNWCVQEVRWFGSATNHVWGINDKYPVTVTRYADQPLRLDFYVYSDSMAGLDIDWILARKCTATEPVCSVVRVGPRSDAWRVYQPFISTVPADLTPERTESDLSFSPEAVASLETVETLDALTLIPTSIPSLTPSAGERISVCPLYWNGLGMRVIDAGAVLSPPAGETAIGFGGSDTISLPSCLAELYLDPDGDADHVLPSGSTGLTFGGDDHVYPEIGEEGLSLHAHSGITVPVILALTPTSTTRRGGQGGLSLTPSSTVSIGNPDIPSVTLELGPSAIQRRRISF